MATQLLGGGTSIAPNATVTTSAFNPGSAASSYVLEFSGGGPYAGVAIAVQQSVDGTLWSDPLPLTIKGQAVSGAPTNSTGASIQFSLPVTGFQVRFVLTSLDSVHTFTAKMAASAVASASDPTLASLVDIDETSVGAGKVLTATASNGLPYSWQSPGGSSIAYDAHRTADGSLQHYFPIQSETSASSHLVDTVGSNTGVVLNSANGLIGAPGLLADGSKSVQLFALSATDWLVLPATLFPAYNHAQTLDFWVDFRGYNATDNKFLFAFDDAKGLELQAETNGSLQMWIGNSSYAVSTSADANVLQGLHYVAITYDGTSTVKVYVDGQLLTTNADALVALSGNGAIGASPNQGGPSALKVSKIAISNTALSASAVLANYKAGLGIV